MLHGKSVLIVEDNGFIALDLSFAVEEAGGHVVGPVASVADALQLIDTAHVSGAVLDCQLLDRDITPVVLRLVERGVPLIIHTGTGLPPALADAHPGLPVARKPLRPEVVVELLIARIRNAERSGCAANAKLH